MSTLRNSTAARKDVTKGLVRQPGGSIRYNKDGSISATELFRCLYTVALAQAPIRNESQHPIFSSLYCQEVTITELEAGMAEITVDYVGDAATDGAVISASRLPDPTFELITEASEAPIETFPSFSSTIGTTGNGAVFDANNVFQGWAKTSPYVGIQSFLTPTPVWRENGMRRTKPSSTELNEVGHISSPYSGSQSPPAASGSRNWLLRAFTYSYEGKIYRYQKEWVLSGPRGFNTDIYT